VARILGVLALVVLLELTASSCCICTPRRGPQLAQPPKKVAVLISTEEAAVPYQDPPPGVDTFYNTEFWNDLVLTYCTLSKNGFGAENIYVLYGDGQDFRSERPGYRPPYCDGSRKLTDIALTGPSGVVKDNICSVLCCLATGHPAVQRDGRCRCCRWGTRARNGFSCRQGRIPRLGAGDYLFVWLEGHGYRYDGGSLVHLPNVEQINLRDSEIERILKGLSARRRTLVFETCKSGGLVDNLDDANTVVVASSGPYEDSYPAYFTDRDGFPASGEEVAHGRLSFWLNAALQGAPCGETAHDNLVSIKEAYTAAIEELQAENSTQTPVLGDRGDIAPCIFIRLPSPGKDEQVFSRDQVADDATVPSGTNVSAETPDLWMEKDENGEWRPLTRVGEPEDKRYELTTDGTYRLVAQVHNIGCANAGRVEVTFSYAKFDECDNAAAWTLIGTAPVDSVPVLSSRPAVQLWTPADQLQEGRYCLIATLSATGDQANADGRAYWDDNKVRMTFTVLPPPPDSPDRP